MSEHVDTVVIGAGQAGLATGYHLARRGARFAILDRHARVGDVWRERYESLRLFTPARMDHLPGRRFPAPPSSYPTGAQMADYLEEYARELALPVRGSVSVERVRAAGEGYVVETNRGPIDADQVVVASGGHARPWTPEIARDVAPGIVQLHSTGYRGPAQLPDGPVLVVGASHSGGDLALEAAQSGHPTILSGRVHGELPIDLEGRRARLAGPLLGFAARHVLTMRTPMGRRTAPVVRAGGAPLLRVKLADLLAAGVEHVPARTVGTRDGRPVLEDGRVLDVAAILWCTGFREDYTWVEPAEVGADGYPVADRGVCPAPGLYFMGLPFQYAFASGMVHGVGRDAAHVVRHVVARTRTGEGRRPRVPAPSA